MPPGCGLKVIDKKQVDRCAPDCSEDRYHFGGDLVRDDDAKATK
jgi:hypothetical protein